VLAPDPLFRGVERARHLNEFIRRDWANIFELTVDEWSVFSLLLRTHVAPTTPFRRSPSSLGS